MHFDQPINSSPRPSSSEDETNDDQRAKEFIGSRELRRGRMHSDDLQSIAAFRRYDRGDATMRLYVKNLAKSVIYGSASLVIVQEFIMINALFTAI